MDILISADDRISCDPELILRIEGVLEGKLECFGERVARVEVRLSDLNSAQVGYPDKQCRMEARVSGSRTVLVSHAAATLAEAIHHAADTLRRLIAECLRRSASAKPTASNPPLPRPTG